jgi:hypothetical protein
VAILGYIRCRGRAPWNGQRWMSGPGGCFCQTRLSPQPGGIAGKLGCFPNPCIWVEGQGGLGRGKWDILIATLKSPVQSFHSGPQGHPGCPPPRPPGASLWQRILILRTHALSGSRKEFGPRTKSSSCSNPRRPTHTTGFFFFFLLWVPWKKSSQKNLRSLKNNKKMGRGEVCLGAV